MKPSMHSQDRQDSIIKDGIVIFTEDTPQSFALRSFIEASYAKHFQANIKVDMPVMVGYHQDGKILAAMGLRPADSGPLFLEQYLNDPIESYISDHDEHVNLRACIVEVGSLATATTGIGRQIIPLFIQTVCHMNYCWAVLSATDRLVHIFNQMGLQPSKIAKCDPTRLHTSRHLWGSYYTHNPHVLMGNLNALRSFKGNWPIMLTTPSTSTKSFGSEHE